MLCNFSINISKSTQIYFKPVIVTTSPLVHFAVFSNLATTALHLPYLSINMISSRSEQVFSEAAYSSESLDLIHPINLTVLKETRGKCSSLSLIFVYSLHLPHSPLSSHPPQLPFPANAITLFELMASSSFHSYLFFDPKGPLVMKIIEEKLRKLNLRPSKFNSFLT